MYKKRVMTALAGVTLAASVVTGCSFTVVESPNSISAKNKADDGVTLNSYIDWRNGFCQSMLNIGDGVADVGKKYNQDTRTFKEVAVDYINDLKAQADGFDGLSNTTFDSAPLLSNSDTVAKDIAGFDKAWTNNSLTLREPIDLYRSNLDTILDSVTSIPDEDRDAQQLRADTFSNDVNNVIQDFVKTLGAHYPSSVPNQATGAIFSSSVPCKALEEKGKTDKDTPNTETPAQETAPAEVPLENLPESVPAPTP